MTRGQIITATICCIPEKPAFDFTRETLDELVRSLPGNGVRVTQDGKTIGRVLDLKRVDDTLEARMLLNCDVLKPVARTQMWMNPTRIKQVDYIDEQRKEVPDGKNDT